MLLDAYAGAWRPEDKRPASEWGAEFVKVPGSARAERFDPSASPWLIEPLNCIPDNRNKEIVVMMPTGAGKTTLFDVCVPRAIVEDPGSILLTQQTDREAQDYWAERIEPTLKNVPSIRRMLDDLPRGKVKKGTIVFPHLTFYCVPANETEAQRKSVRWVYIDEAWKVKHGLVAQLRARTHDRWNQRIVIVSQGGVSHILDQKNLVLTELEEAWTRTDQRRNSMVCPECDHVHAWTNRQLLYEDAPADELDRIDENAILQSARYRCPGKCGIEFADKIDIRRMLSTESRYVPTNQNHLARHVGFHTTAHALYYIAWGQLALEWKRASVAAKLGDSEPRKIYIQKRLAENWKANNDSAQVVLSAAAYSLTDFANGEPIEGETERVMTVDCQQGEKGDLSHYWVRIRGWRNDGASRGVFFGRIETEEQLEQLQTKFKVRERVVFVDAQWNTDEILAMCSRHGWTAIHGTDRVNSFPHHKVKRATIHKLFSPVRWEDAGIGKKQVLSFTLVTQRIKDVLAALIAGRSAPFEHATDESDAYLEQMRSETKRPVFDRAKKRYAFRWEPLTDRTANHAWDCEVYQVGAALMLNLLKGWETIETKDGEEAVAPIDTAAEAAV